MSLDWSLEDCTDIQFGDGTTLLHDIAPKLNCCFFKTEKCEFTDLLEVNLLVW